MRDGEGMKRFAGLAEAFALLPFIPAGCAGLAAAAAAATVPGRGAASAGWLVPRRSVMVGRGVPLPACIGVAPRLAFS